MGCVATGANSYLSRVKEVTYGETPITPTMLTQRFSSNGINETRDTIDDTSITSRRDQTTFRTGNSTVGGDLSGQFAPKAYDDLIESAMLGAWTVGDGVNGAPVGTDYILNGNSVTSFTIEDGQNDISIFRQFTGMVADTFAVTAPVDGAVDVSFTMAGKKMTVDAQLGVPDDSAGESSTEFFTHKGGTLSEGGVPSAIVQSVDVTVANNFAGIFVWGGDGTVLCQNEGSLNVTGTLEVFYTDDVLLNKFLNETPSDLEFSLVAPNGDSLNFFLPNIRFAGGDVPVADRDSPRILTMPFTAIYSTDIDTIVGENGTIKIERTYA